jgi:BlaI family penicillinase repressor
MPVMITATSDRGHPDEILAKRLGPLEMDVLDILWAMNQATSRDILGEIQKRKNLKSNTIHTVLKRLNDRGFVKRDGSGDVYVYSPVLGRLEVGNQLIDNIVDRVFQGAVEPVLMHLLSRDDARGLRLELLDRVYTDERAGNNDTAQFKAS